MSTAQSTVQTSTEITRVSLAVWIRRHPVVAYFTIAFTGTWLFFVPILVSQRGLGWLVLPDAAASLLFIAATYAGPFLSAFAVTTMVEGGAGVRRLIRRIFQWRVGIQWYLLLFLGYPVMFILGLTGELGTGPVNTLLQNLPALLPAYVTNILVGMFLPGLGEETGWRGFALPHLQSAYGALLASLILGSLHALWHLPAYLVLGMISAGGFDPIVFVANSLAIVAATLIWTWLFNHTRASILFAILIHATSNATSLLVPRLVSGTTGDPWFGLKVVGIVAVALVVLTRGQLGYRPASNQ